MDSREAGKYIATATMIVHGKNTHLHTDDTFKSYMSLCELLFFYKIIVAQLFHLNPFEDTTTRTVHMYIHFLMQPMPHSTNSGGGKGTHALEIFCTVRM